jgi:hypothetical protein
MDANNYTLKNIIEVIYEGQTIKLSKEEFYMDGKLTSTHYYLVDNIFEKYKQCVKCNDWMKWDESEWVYCYDKRLGRNANTRACLRCYQSVKRQSDTDLYHKKLIKGYLDELLFINTRMTINSDFETDSSFFNNYQYCFLTGIKDEGASSEKTVHLDHFIANYTGHVGRIIGNIYPLHYRLNLSKSNKNPFEWIKEEAVKSQIRADKWDKLINYFAHCYGLTLDEYKDFVYWCYGNPRRIKDIERDGNITSLELWRRSQ